MLTLSRRPVFYQGERNHIEGTFISLLSAVHAAFIVAQKGSASQPNTTLRLMVVSSAMQRRVVFICILFPFFLPRCVSLRSGHCRETHRNCELAELANNYNSPCPNIIKSMRLNHNSIIMLTCVNTTPSLCCSSVHCEGSILRTLFSSLSILVVYTFRMFHYFTLAHKL